MAATAVAVLLLLLYQPIVHGSVAGYDQHLLIDARRSDPSDAPDAYDIYEYRFHARTSYFTLSSIRNDGPLPIALLGIDTSDPTRTLIPSVDATELLTAASPDDPHNTVELSAARPLPESVIAPGDELNVWIRWEIGPCDPANPRPYGQDSGVGRSSIDVRWSVLGIPRSSTVDLGYTVAFQVNGDGVAVECQPAT